MKDKKSNTVCSWCDKPLYRSQGRLNNNGYSACSIECREKIRMRDSKERKEQKRSAWSFAELG